MDLWLENPTETFNPYYGQPIPTEIEGPEGPEIDDVSYPANIVDLWTTEQLNAIGLFVPVRDPVASGKRIASSIVKRVDGVVKYVDTYEDVVITDEDVNIQRDGRTLPGRITVTSALLAAPIPVDMRIPTDRDNLVLLSDIAKNKSAFGDTSPIAFRDADNVIHSLTIQQILILATACAAYGSAVYAASWALKDNPPIPTDYRDDAHWPSTDITFPPA